MSKKKRHPVVQAARVLGWIVLGALVGFLLLVVFASLIFPTGAHLVIFHLAAGFAFFLTDRIQLISADAGTWGPGLVAFFLGLGVVHRLMGAWAAKRAKPWTIGSTLCLGALLPILFAISFLIPGILLQLETLREVRVFEDRDRRATFMVIRMRDVALELFMAADSTDGRFPESLEDLPESAKQALDRLALVMSDGSGLLEPPIYLGAGTSESSDPELPLLISPVFSDKGRPMRCVATLGMGVIRIHDMDTEAWIEKALAARAAEPEG